MLGNRFNPGHVAQALQFTAAFLLLVGCPAESGVLELRIGTPLSSATETMPLDEQRRRASCQECVPLTWEFADGSRTTFLVEESPAARIPLTEIEKSYIVASQESETTPKLFILAIRPTERGLEAIVDAKRYLRPVFVFFDDEPVGLGGALPVASYYSLGEFDSLERAECVAERLGLSIEPFEEAQ